MVKFLAWACLSYVSLGIKYWIMKFYLLQDPTFWCFASRVDRKLRRRPWRRKPRRRRMPRRSSRFNATSEVFFPKQFTVGVLNAVLSVSALAGVLCPPRWACLRSCLPICLRICLLSFNLGGVLCSPRWASLPICLPPGFVSQFCFPICSPSGFVSASLGLSPNLSANLSPI